MKSNDKNIQSYKMRIIFDKMGASCKDLIFKLDVLPPYIKIFDSCYLSDFLELHFEEIPESEFDWPKYNVYSVKELIKYLIDRIDKIKLNEKVFIPFDFSDQYIAGVMMHKLKKGFKCKYAFTIQLQGHSTSKSLLDKQLQSEDITFQFEDKQEWLLSEQYIQQGLRWSLDELNFIVNQYFLE